MLWRIQETGMLSSSLRSNGLAEGDELASKDWLADVDGWLAGIDALTAVDWSACDFGLKKVDLLFLRSL
jgi:hypothetical protein